MSRHGVDIEPGFAFVDWWRLPLTRYHLICKEPGCGFVAHRRGVGRAIMACSRHLVAFHPDTPFPPPPPASVGFSRPTPKEA